MKERIEFTLDLVRQAAENVKKLMQEEVHIDTKSARDDFVTNVDKQTEMFLVEGIKAAFKNQDFITEEKVIATKGLDDVWIIDPIDGTTNFIYERRNFGISVAFYHKKQPVFGIVYDVMGDEMFLGIKGEGAFVNGRKLPMLNQELRLKDAIVYSDVDTLLQFGPDFKKEIISHRYLGSAALEICGVAANRFQVYAARFMRVWDVAAASIILKEVGGSFEYGGLDNEIHFSDENGEWYCGSNDPLLCELKAYM